MDVFQFDKNETEKVLPVMATATLTMGTGIGQIFELLPKAVGSIASVLGIILTAYFIQKARISIKKIKLETEIKEAELKQLKKGG